MTTNIKEGDIVCYTRWLGNSRDIFAAALSADENWVIVTATDYKRRTVESIEAVENKPHLIRMATAFEIARLQRMGLL